MTAGVVRSFHISPLRRRPLRRRPLRCIRVCARGCGLQQLAHVRVVHEARVAQRQTGRHQGAALLVPHHVPPQRQGHGHGVRVRGQRGAQGGAGEGGQLAVKAQYVTRTICGNDPVSAAAAAAAICC